LEKLYSVGIDVGTSTTQVVFSELCVADTSGHFRIPEAKITDKRVLYRSPIHPTPLLDFTRIDADALRQIVATEYKNAGISVGGTDTGAVIITGESARKENAAAVLAGLSGFAGKFVVATAGPDLESRIAGQGSGAQEFSRMRKCGVVNLDIGGGTTNLAFFQSGDFVGCSCYDIGGKMLQIASGGTLSAMSHSAQNALRYLNLRLTIGTVPERRVLEKLATVLADELATAAQGKTSALLEKLRTPGSSLPPARVFADSRISYSGGVADCIWDDTLSELAYGDFGVYLGKAIRGNVLSERVLRSEETIRATVIGAGSHTTELSGSTVHYSSAELFPLQDIPVYAASSEQEAALWRGDCADFAQDFLNFIHQTDSPHAAVELNGKANPGYRELTLLARALVRSLTGQPLIILLHEDNAKVLGQLMRPLAGGRALIVLDSIYAGANTYLDIGKPVLGGMTLPVIVKTLILGV
jgi:ethanolamine utilization protein EutA